MARGDGVIFERLSTSHIKVELVPLIILERSEIAVAVMLVSSCCSSSRSSIKTRAAYYKCKTLVLFKGQNNRQRGVSEEQAFYFW